MNVMKVIKENFVTVSINNPILINKFPRSNKYNPRQTIMKSVSITDNGKEDIAEKIHIEIKTRIIDDIYALQPIIEAWREKFTSINGSKFYELDINKDKINLVKKEWILDEFTEFNNIKVKNFYGGKKLRWKIES